MREKKLAIAAIAAAVVALWLGRYDIETVSGGFPSVARLDRWTGAVDFCTMTGCRSGQ